MLTRATGISSRDSIDAAEVNRSLHGTRLSGLVHHLPVVDSTNRLALEAAAAGETDGAWIADEQTAGRGRGGHTWHSAPGEGLYVSMLFTPALTTTAAVQLSLAAGLAAQEAIESVAGITVDLRWPNDLVTYGQERSRKLGGILVETAAAPVTAAHPGLVRHVVIGIGINVSHRVVSAGAGRHGLFPASSKAGAPPPRQPLLLALLERVDWNVRQLELARDSEGGGNGPCAAPIRLHVDSRETCPCWRRRRLYWRHSRSGYPRIPARPDRRWHPAHGSLGRRTRALNLQAAFDPSPVKRARGTFQPRSQPTLDAARSRYRQQQYRYGPVPPRQPKGHAQFPGCGLAHHHALQADPG